MTVILLYKVASYSIILTLTNCDGCPIIFSSANKSVQNRQVKLHYFKKNDICKNESTNKQSVTALITLRANFKVGKPFIMF